jgi:hypothetical protein
MTGGRTSRQGGGWPVMLADLALILFVTTAVQAEQSAAREGSQAGSPPAAPGVPQAYYLAEPGAPPFAQWIAGQGQGSAAQVTIISSYRPGESDAALARAQALAHEAQAAGRPPRVLVEPGDGTARAILAYDEAQPARRAQ